MPLAAPLLIIAILAGALYALRQAGTSSADDPIDSASSGDPGLVGEVVAAPSELAAALGHTVDAVKKLWSPPAAAAPYVGAIQRAEEQNGIPANLIARQLDIESDHFNPLVIDGSKTSRTGAVGIGQFEPPTSAELGLDPTDPFASINATAKMMRKLYDKFGSWEEALAAYNWGQGHVQRLGLDAAPKETRDYIKAILTPIGLT